MSIVERIHRSKIIRYDRLLEWYPLFFFIGARIRFSKDYRKISLGIPLRWYLKNNNGVLFGGVMCLLSDPFPALVFEKIIPGTSAWNRTFSIDYLLPAKTRIEAKIEITEQDIDELKHQLNEKGKAQKTFEYYFIDKHDRQIAKVSNTIYLRKRNGEKNS
ncbi:MAG: DUF4442 domain-containing protein [Bacteroidales bacterium]|nr:DUF4442 domain-containing protein [Bacteroidales bacterium]